jgi:hypothetical protein
VTEEDEDTGRFVKKLKLLAPNVVTVSHCGHNFTAIADKIIEEQEKTEAASKLLYFSTLQAVTK